MSGDDIVKTADGHDVILGWNYLQCSCPTYIQGENWCTHIEDVLALRQDADWVRDEILAASDVKVLAVPLFVYTHQDGKTKQFIYRQVNIHPKTTPAGLMGVCRFEVPDFPAVGDWGSFPGTIKAGGRAYAPAGVITPGEGRRDIATSVSSWVAAQLALANSMQIAEIECDSFTHLDHPLTPLDKSCIILSGECTDCYVRKPTSFAPDVPDF